MTVIQKHNKEHVLPSFFVPLAHSDFVNSSTTFCHELSLFGYEFLLRDCELLGWGACFIHLCK